MSPPGSSSAPRRRRHPSPAPTGARSTAAGTHQPQTTGSAEPRSWLVLIYRVPQDPPGRRSYVWRQLKQLGAVYLQQAAAILPHSPETSDALHALADRIRGMDGEVSLLETASPDGDWEADVIARFNQARDAEYQEIVESVERFEDEIRRESRKERYTFAELEESETDWEKLRRWQERVAARDFFGAPDRAAADEAMARGRVALDAFTREVFIRENLDLEDAAHEAANAAHRAERRHGG
jgi:hypothetical protein